MKFHAVLEPYKSDFCYRSPRPYRHTILADLSLEQHMALLQSATGGVVLLETIPDLIKLSEERTNLIARLAEVDKLIGRS